MLVNKKDQNTHARLPSYDRDPEVAADDMYKRYKDKLETQEKVRIINEDFIEDIIQRRSKMGLGRGSSHGGSTIGGRRESQES